MLIACAVCFGAGEDGSLTGLILPTAIMTGALLYALFFLGEKYGPVLCGKISEKWRSGGAP